MLVLKWVPVAVTPLMVERAVEFRKGDSFETRKKWVPLEQISVQMVKAVIASEDNRFAQHKGFDTQELRQMLKDHREKGKRIRGCSTISQQTAKNVFTSGRPTWIRKISEAYFTFLIEKIWGKERIMEVYLNVVELGKGIYGVEAASREYYGHGAATLTLQQASALACCLPNPLVRTPRYMLSRRPGRVDDIVSLTYKISYPEWVTREPR